MTSAPALELAHIDKRFGAVHANRDISLTAAKGSIHGIVGENGAGKSTLMSIVYGFYEADSGEIRIDGAPVRIRSSRDAIARGVGMVHQHFMLVEPLSVIENIRLGAEGGALLSTGDGALRTRLERLAKDYGLAIDPDARVGDLPVGLQQRVEILKALTREARILILDEPTAVLTPAEADQLFVMLRALRDEGKTVLLITHKLREIMDVTDRVSVMRRGQMVAHFDTATTNPQELAAAMVGRPVTLKVEKGPANPGAPRLQAKNLVVRDSLGVARLNKVSLDLRAGEIVGVAGVSGNGQSELLLALAGVKPAQEGVVMLDGVDATRVDPSEMRRRGLAHVPEDRHHMGLVLPFTEAESAILGYHRDPSFGLGPLLDPQAVRADAQNKIRAYDVQPPDVHLKSANFSGGNQQKIVLAREMERNPKVLLVGQPTRGVDIGAIEFIHKRLIEMRDAGCAILVVSVELDEIMALADRIVVMCGGRVTGERRADRTNAQELGMLMAGMADAERAA